MDTEIIDYSSNDIFNKLNDYNFVKSIDFTKLPWKKIREIKILRIPIITANNQPDELFVTVDQLTIDLSKFNLFNIIKDNCNIFIVSDKDNNPASYVKFEVIDENTWQAKEAITYNPYKGQALAAKIYHMIATNSDYRILSNSIQTSDAARMWTKTLPGFKVYPNVYDLVNKTILDPKSFDVYSAEPPDRYVWIIE